MSGVAWSRVALALHDTIEAALATAYPVASARPLLYLATELWTENVERPAGVVTVAWSGDVDDEGSADAGQSSAAYATLRSSGRERDESGLVIVRVDSPLSETARAAMTALGALTDVVEGAYRQTPHLGSGLPMLSCRTDDYRPTTLYDGGHLASALLSVAYTART